MLSIKNLKYYFDNLLVIDSIDGNFEKGKISVILGPSGCGKSTLLNLLAKALDLQSGEISYKSSKELDYSVGYVFQTPSLVPWLTIRQNALFGADLIGNITEITHKKCNSLLEAYGLMEFQNSYPNSLSGGMQQRVSMIRAALSKSEVILLDEPFSNSDFLMRRSLQIELSKLVDEEQLIAILVTHDIEEALRIGDKVYVLSDRPANIELEMEIPISRKDRLYSNQSITMQLAEYASRVWKAFDATPKND